MAADTPASRLIAARERTGLSPDAVAHGVGLTVAAYADLEAYPNDLFMCISLADLQALGEILQIAPAELFGAAQSSAGPDIPFSEVVQRLNALRAAGKASVEELSTQIGYDLRDVLVDPSELWKFNIDGLRAVCKAVNLEWLAVLPSRPLSHGPATAT